MVDWKSPEELKRDAVAFDKVVHIWLGIYVWEWITSLKFEWEFVTRKKKFMWPMIFYFLNRYCLLFSLTGIVIAQNMTTKFDCQALYTFNQVFGSASIGFASINLSLRMIAVWSRKWYILYPIVMIILGHWSLLLHGIFMKVEWIQGQGCTFTKTNNTIMIAIYIYTMVFDFIITFLTAIKLVSPSSRKHSRLMQLMFQDGLIYFILAFLSNLIATTIMVLNLNAVMSLIANIPATTLSTIVACRIVRRLHNFDNTEISSNQLSSALVFGSFTPKDTLTEGIHVQMEPALFTRSNTSDFEAQIKPKGTNQNLP